MPSHVDGDVLRVPHQSVIMMGPHFTGTDPQMTRDAKRMARGECKLLVDA